MLPFRALRLSLILLGLAALTGCDRSAAGRADLVILNGAEPETLDPHLMTGQLEQRLAYALYEGLVFNDEAGEIKPGVAESWDMSPDGLTYTFHLRRNATWSNGNPVTAHDFVASWRRALEPATAAEYAGQLHYIKNAKPFNEGTLKDFSQVGVRAPDDYTVVVALENPTPFFIGLCATTPLLPVHATAIAAKDGAWMRPGKMISNGAYELAAWRLNDRIRLRKNPHYWAKDGVKMETIDVLPINRPNTALNFYGSGQADVIIDKFLTPVGLLSELKKRPDFHSGPFLGVLFVRFNVLRKPFNDSRVRLAFAYAIDRKEICEKILKAGELPAFSMTPPGTGGYAPPRGVSFDEDRAQLLLAAAGYPGGKGFPPVSYLYNEGDLSAAVAVELQAMFKRVLNVQVNLRPMENKVYQNTMSQLDYDLCRSSWIGDYNDPNTFLDLFLTGAGNNRTGWGNPVYDKLIGEAAAELDIEKRHAIFRRAEQLLISEGAPVAPIHFYVGVQMYDADRLGGLQANLLDEHPFKSMYWKKR